MSITTPATPETTTAQRIIVLPLSDHEWRVTDSSREEKDGAALLGFVQRVAGVYEVVPLESPLEPVFFESFEAALGFLTPLDDERAS